MKFEPAPRAINLVPKRRQKAKRQADERASKRNIQGTVRKMVIDQRGRPAGHHSDSKPDRMTAQKIVNVVVAILRKSARAEKNHDADREQPEDRQEEEIRAFAMHRS